MDLKEIQSKTIERVILFVENVEQKLNSVKIIHEKLNDLLSIVTKTHENILEELISIKNILNQQDQQIDKFNSKSSTNFNSQQINSPITQQSDRLSLCSGSSCDSSSSLNSTNTNKSSNLKKVSQSSNRPKSPKSVTFQFDQQINLTNSNQSTKINSDLIPQLFQQHHKQIIQQKNIGFKLGNALTNVRIHEIESENGDYLRLLNVSNSDDYDLSGHFIQQNLTCVPFSQFKFPSNTFIRAGQTITIWCGSTTNIEAQPPHVFLWKEQRRWETGPECVTILAKPNGQAIAWARSSNRLNTNDSSGDILFVHSKGIISTTNSTTSNGYQTRSRLSTSNFIGNCKPPFAHSPSNSIHPDCNSTTINQIRSQINYKGNVSQLLTRPKSSPFSSHIGCKQDLRSLNSLQKSKKQTTIQT